MKHTWYIITVLLLIALLAGFSGLTKSPTSAFIANLPPEWDYPTTQFMAQDGHFTLDLGSAFFDPDADDLTYGVEVGTNMSAGVNGSILFVMTQEGGTLTLIASDGKTITSQQITVNV